MGETSPSAPLAQPPPLSRGGFGMSVRFMLDEQSTMSREQECSAVQGSGSLTRCVVQKLLPSVARPALLRHIGPQASSGKLPDMPKPLPLGEVAPKVTERASQLRQSRRTAMRRLFCQSDTIAVLSLLRQRPCPLRRFAPALPKGEPFRTPHRTARSLPPSPCRGSAPVTASAAALRYAPASASGG